MVAILMALAVVVGVLALWLYNAWPEIKLALLGAELGLNEHLKGRSPLEKLDLLYGELQQRFDNLRNHVIIFGQRLLGSHGQAIVFYDTMGLLEYAAANPCSMGCLLGAMQNSLQYASRGPADINTYIKLEGRAKDLQDQIAYINGIANKLRPENPPQ